MMRKGNWNAGTNNLLINSLARNCGTVFVFVDPKKNNKGLHSNGGDIANSSFRFFFQ
jgi:hypothetical protein